MSHQRLQHRQFVPFAGERAAPAGQASGPGNKAGRVSLEEERDTLAQIKGPDLQVFQALRQLPDQVWHGWLHLEQQTEKAPITALALLGVEHFFSIGWEIDEQIASYRSEWFRVLCASIGKRSG